MNRLALLLMTALLLGPTCPIQAASTLPQNADDWHLYMLKLVNRARVDPVGEDLRQGTSYNESPAQPLAYNLLIGRVADNHSQWMGLNRAIVDDGLPNDPPPDSFSHYETATGQSGGPTGNGTTIGWTGDGLGQRFDYVGFEWSNIAENILTWSATRPVNKANLETDFSLWWKSSGHRHNLMNNVYTAFGYAYYNDPSGSDRRFWSTQNFGTPLYQPKNYILGLLYDDKNGNHQWDPYNTGDPNRESLGPVNYQVRQTGTTTTLASGQSFDNGALAINIGNGTYDLLFDLPGYGPFLLQNITVAGTNVDIGELVLPASGPIPGDFTRDGQVEQDDLTALLSSWGQTSVPANWLAPFDGQVDQNELDDLLTNWGSGVADPDRLDAHAVPEPAGLLLGWLLAVPAATRKRQPPTE